MEWRRLYLANVVLNGIHIELNKLSATAFTFENGIRVKTTMLCEHAHATLESVRRCNDKNTSIETLSKAIPIFIEVSNGLAELIDIGIGDSNESEKYDNQFVIGRVMRIIRQIHNLFHIEPIAWNYSFRDSIKAIIFELLPYMYEKYMELRVYHNRQMNIAIHLYETTT